MHLHPRAGRLACATTAVGVAVTAFAGLASAAPEARAASTRLRAVRDATVTGAGSGDGRANWMALYSRPDRLSYVYFHMQRPAEVEPGERVRAGRRIGRLGCTGSCFGDHLHFEVHRGRATGGAAIDPMSLLRRWAR